MPIKRRIDLTGIGPTSQPEPEEGFSKTGAAIRGLSGLLGATGGIPGAIAGGGGEAFAQLIEYLQGIGKDQSIGQRLARVGTESALGTIPAAKAIKPFRLLGNFIRSGLLSGGGDVARQLAEQGTLDPSNLNLGRTALATGIGATAGAGAQAVAEKLFPGIAKAAEAGVPRPTPKGRTVPVGPPVRTEGGRPTSGNVKELSDFFKQLQAEAPERLGKPGRTGFRAPESMAGGTVSTRPEPFVGTFQKELNKTLSKLKSNRDTLKELDEAIAAEDKVAKARIGRERTSAAQMDRLEQRADKELYEAERRLAEKAEAEARKVAEREAKQAAANARIEEAKAAGLEPGPPSVRETYTAERPGGRETATTVWRAPDGEGEVVSRGGSVVAPAETITEEDIPLLFPEGSKARNLYDQWRASGSSHIAALKAVERGSLPKVAPPPSVPRGTTQTKGVSIPDDLPPLPGEAPALEGLRKLLTFENPLEGADLWYRTLSDEARSGGEFPKTFKNLIGRALARAKKGAGLSPNQPLEESAPEAAARVAAAAPEPPARVLPDYTNMSEEDLIRRIEILRKKGTPMDQAHEIPAIQDELTSRAGTPALDVNSPFYEAAAEAAAQKAGRPVGAAADEATVAALREGLPGLDELKDLLGRLTKEESGGATNELALALASAAAGGLGGYAAGEAFGYDPVLAGLAGAGISAGAPFLASRASQIGPTLAKLPRQLKESVGSPENVSDLIASTAEKVPQIQRSNLLTSGHGLAANAFAGPYGSTLMAGLELAMKGDPRGIEVLRQGANPISFARNMARNWPEAQRLVAMGELGRAEGMTPGPVDTVAKAYLSAAPTAMTSGDITARNAMEAAGLPEELARMYTLTSEPGDMFRGFVNWARGTPKNDLDRVIKAGLNTMFPFRRTPTNILEQGMYRTPGVGAIARTLEAGGRPNLRDVAAEQALGGLVAAGSYGVGSQLDPETARTVKRYVSNLGGVYSLPASLGFTAGQANARGRSSKALGTDVIRDVFPLPTEQPFLDLWNLVSGGEVPRGALPSFAYDAVREANRPPTRTIPDLPSIQGFRNRRPPGGF